ncbi:MAG: glycosyltransferase [Dehalococcoidia bacterium]
MYGTLALTPKSLKEYVPAAGKERIDELVELSEPLRGLRVLNLSVTAFGTGLAELLRSTVPLFCDLGIDWQWQVVRAGEDATQVNRAMYRALAGGRVEWTPEMTETWRRYTVMNAELLNEDFDVVIVHDPQPAAIRSYVDPARRGKRWLMHCHIDLSAAQLDVWELLEGHLQDYDCWTFEDEQFAGRAGAMPLGRQTQRPCKVIAPAIDPLGPRNIELSADATAYILGHYGIDGERPFIAQVAPINEENDTLGALEVYRLMRREAPDLQLVLLAPSPPDEAAYPYFEEVREEATKLPDVHILADLNDVGNVEVNVVQRASFAVMQRSLQRGFGIWLSDALWKETPVVGARMGGVPKQVLDGRTGYLADSDAEFADCLLRLMREPATARELGVAARRHVAENFLVCRFIADYLSLLREIS